MQMKIETTVVESVMMLWICVVAAAVAVVLVVVEQSVEPLNQSLLSFVQVALFVFEFLFLDKSILQKFV